MFKKLKKMLEKKEERKKDLKKKAEACEAIEELRGINSEVDKLNDEIEELRGLIAEAEKAEGSGEGETRSGSPVGESQVLATYGVGSGESKKEEREEDPYNTIEYRKAFMSYITRGQVTEDLLGVNQPELRLDAYTGTTDVSAVIPTTIMNELIEKLEEYGEIFRRVRKTNIQGGVDVPILSLKPTAEWITEAAPSDRKKVQSNTKVQFSYYGLECKVAMSLLASITSLNMFEREITRLLVEAMVEAMDKAIIAGSGDGAPLGITVDERVPNGNIITLTADDVARWDSWKKKVFAKIPLKYRARGSFIMASGTFEGYIDGMVDANGQPIGRTNYGITNGTQERFGGREVLLVEDDVIAPYDSANSDDVIAVFCKLSDYCINSNMQLTMFKWTDHDTNQIVDKAILVADGKLLDANGVMIIKKA